MTFGDKYFSFKDDTGSYADLLKDVGPLTNVFQTIIPDNPPKEPEIFFIGRDGQSYRTNAGLAAADELWHMENNQYLGGDGQLYPTSRMLNAANMVHAIETNPKIGFNAQAHDAEALAIARSEMRCATRAYEQRVQLLRGKVAASEAPKMRLASFNPLIKKR